MVSKPWKDRQNAPEKSFKTSNIDKLAENGVYFNQFFCSSPVCVPSRATSME